ncbi:MAG: YHS domain-containing protein [Agarilytica sp.]
MKNFIRYSVIIGFLGLSASAFSEAIYTDFFSDKALSGYDTVAYFKAGKPIKGKKEHTSKYLGVKWFFSSAKNKALFDKEPDKYRPQFGGHCAWAVAENNAKAKGDPQYWRIVDDKLYLNYNADVQNKWLKDIPGFIVQGNKNWSGLATE